MFLLSVVAILVILILDAFLVGVTFAIITGIRNTIAREELQVRSNLLWAVLLLWVTLSGIVILTANAVAIAYLLQ